MVGTDIELKRQVNSYIKKVNDVDSCISSIYSRKNNDTESI
jgi:hypothetical protein